MSRALVAICLLALWALPGSAEDRWPPANLALLHSARFWEAHERGDLAQLALVKLVAARPDSPEALVELGELYLRINNFAEAARIEGELSTRFKGSPSARDFSLEYRLATRDRLQFVSARRLFELERYAEGKVALERLFPGGAPQNALGIEYYLLLADTANGLDRALEGLSTLAAQHSDDMRYQMALARLMLRRPETRLAGLMKLQGMLERDDARREDVDKLIATGLVRSGAERAPTAVLQAYLLRHPDDGDVLEVRSRQQQAAEERLLLSPDTWVASTPAIQRRLADVLAKPGASSPARDIARAWLQRSRASTLAHQDALAALELRAALAFGRSDFEEQIGLSKALEDQGAVREAGDLLADAAGLEPESTWLFETKMRWFIGHGQAARAIDALRARALTKKWDAQSRDTLLAAAFDQRAGEEANAGGTEAAIADLKQAIELKPVDPWLRFRLAELYADQSQSERGRALMNEGARAAPNDPVMRYAQALYLANIKDYAAGLAAIAATNPARRSESMNTLYDRLRVSLARQTARRLKAAGDGAGARAALLDADPVASHGIERAADLAYAWIELGLPAHGIDLVHPYLEGAGAQDPKVLLIWAQVLNSADDTARLGAVLSQLQSLPGFTPYERAQIDTLQRSWELRLVRDLEREGRLAEAAKRLDALLERAPQDRELRKARAELYLTAGQSRAARDRFAALVAEDPGDLDARLSYVRALTDCGDLALARLQLQAVERRDLGQDEDLRMNLARRQLALGNATAALNTLQPLLDRSPPRVDALMLAGRAELKDRHFAQARTYFDQAARSGTAAESVAARRESQEIQDRLQSSVEAGLIVRHQPGAAGMSQLDAITIPTAWLLAVNYEARVTARADAVLLDAGRWSGAPGAALIGTIPTAGSAAQRFTDDSQRGVSPSVGYQNDALSVDVGATPLGFLLPKAVGGVEWTPQWRGADYTLGMARRAVTSSELSYGGLRDPISGTPWGGVVQTGPYGGFGIYKANYGISGSLQVAELTGTHVLDNLFAAARIGGSLKILTAPDLGVDLGGTLNYWHYQHNLSNYTFGSGGYYSPQSYVSLSVPLQVDGRRYGWVYRVRVAPSFSVSRVDDAAFYPNDSSLQAAALHAPLPNGYNAPIFSGYHSSGFGISAYGAAERQVNDWLVVGAMLSIDRTDFYHPTIGEIYFRHAFAPFSSKAFSPPKPIRPYNP